jgi:hypothetical protein
MEDESCRPWSRKIENGEMAICHYKGFLLETYHNAGLNPQLQAYTTMFFKAKHRATIKKFFQHAISEIGHDLLALNDLKILGVDGEFVENSAPLPTTVGFLGNVLYQVQFGSPLSYLGYLFHLEYTPVVNGDKIMNMLKSKGVPNSALTFLEEHSTVDVAHTKLMDAYLESLVESDHGFNVVAQSLKSSIVLHNRMMEGAFENGEKLFSDK